MIILVINCGSSSIKYQVLDMKNDNEYSLLAKGILERIAMPMSKLTHKPTGKTPVVMEMPVADHKIGMRIVLDALVNPEYGVISSFSDIDAVGHRIVQGAEYFDKSVLVDDEVIRKITVCCDFAPLHNPAHLLGIEAVSNVLPDVPQAVTFDTAFHQTMAPEVYMYALPYQYYKKYGVRRYGAHGTSHQYVSQRGAALAGIPLDNSRIITCHIGNGSSVTAIRNGKVVDTSMGFTPLEGMIMGTRCGSIDASLVPYLMKKENKTPDEMTALMNKESGFLGMSEGVTSDCRDLVDRREAGDERARLILAKLVLDITKLVGSYVAEMNGVDLIVFTAGIAENNPWLRRDVSANFAYLGAKIDEEVNAVARGSETIISTPDSKVKIAMIPTDEELVIARDTMHLVEDLRK